MGGRGSGRSGHYHDLDFNELISKSLTIQLRFFDDPNIPDEKKVQYASLYLSKKVSQKIDLAVTHQLNEEQLALLESRINKLKAIEYTAHDNA